jgi:hypothetical protein
MFWGWFNFTIRANYKHFTKTCQLPFVKNPSESSLAKELLSPPLPEPFSQNKVCQERVRFS